MICILAADFSISTKDAGIIDVSIQEKFIALSLMRSKFAFTKYVYI